METKHQGSVGNSVNFYVKLWLTSEGGKKNSAWYLCIYNARATRLLSTLVILSRLIYHPA